MEESGNARLGSGCRGRGWDTGCLVHRAHSRMSKVQCPAEEYSHRKHWKWRQKQGGEHCAVRYRVSSLESLGVADGSGYREGGGKGRGLVLLNQNCWFHQAVYSSTYWPAFLSLLL